MTIVQRKLNIAFRCMIFLCFAAALTVTVSMITFAFKGAESETIAAYDKRFSGYIYTMYYGGCVLLIGTAAALVLSIILMKCGNIISFAARTLLILASLIRQIAGVKSLQLFKIFCKIYDYKDEITFDLTAEELGISGKEFQFLKDVVEEEPDYLEAFLIALLISAFIFLVLSCTSLHSLIKQRNIPEVEDTFGDELSQYYDELNG